MRRELQKEQHEKGQKIQLEKTRDVLSHGRRAWQRNAERARGSVAQPREFIGEILKISVTGKGALH